MAGLRGCSRQEDKKMTDLERLIAIILPEFLIFMDSAESLQKPQKRLDIPSNPSIACDQGGIEK